MSRVTLADLHAQLTALLAREGGGYPPLASCGELDARPKLESPGECAAYLLRTAGTPDGREHFDVITLDVRCRVIRRVTVSVGCLTASLVHPREVFRVAILDAAAAIVLTHNHPSGEAEPSAEDIALTRRLAAAGAVMGIQVLDHIVTGDHSGRWVSLQARGVL